VSYGGWRHHFQKSTGINSEKLRHHICIPIGNNQFFVSPWLAMRTANAVFDIQAHHREPIEHAANIGSLSSGEIKRSRAPRLTSLRTFVAGLVSIHFHSRVAVEKT
jgi:hypothetical protein